MLRVPRVTRIVRHHADGGAIIVQFLQQVHHRFAVLRVQVARRLVRQQDRRLPDNRPRHRHPLLLSARELRRVVLRAVRHANSLERRLHPLLPLRRRHPPIGQRQLHVLVDREVADQVERLEDEADLTVPDPRPLRRAQVGHVLVVQIIRAGAGRIQQPQQREQRGLAAAGRTGTAMYSPRPISSAPRQAWVSTSSV
jgi:hypothetical protein